VTILLTSHNLAEIEELCHRVAVIARGRIRALDTADNLRALHQGVERLRLTVGGLSPAQAREALSGTIEDFALTEIERSLLVAQFTREAEDDDALDRAVRVLQGAGGSILACETERATLFDVLEKYERDEETTGGAQA
jgi:ABC-2 type transport system ATP-binding protein